MEPVVSWEKLPIPRAWLWPITILGTSAVMLALILLSAAQLKAQGRANLESALLTVLGSTQGGLRFWLKDVEGDLSALARLPRVEQLIAEQVRHPEHPDHPVDALDDLESVLKPWVTAHDYLGFSVFTRDDEGRIRPLFEQEPTGAAVLAHTGDAVSRALGGAFALSQPAAVADPHILEADEDREVVMIAATPVMGPSGEPLAALAFYIDAFGTFSELVQLGHMGESGEAYAVDRAGQMLTRSRFKEQPEGSDASTASGSESESGSPLARSLRSGESGVDLDGYRDYRGKLVVGAWLWDPELGLGLVTEIDRAEAYGSYEILERLTWLMIGIVILGMSAILLLREARTRNIRRIEALQQFGRARTELLAVVSHDLKNPLGALLMINEILLRSLPPDLDRSGKRRALLERSHRVAEQMRRLIMDLLDSAKMEAGKLEINPVECHGGPIIDETLEVLEPIAAPRDLRLIRELPGDLPALWADPGRVTQVFSNLLGNAVKFSEPGGQISIRAQQVEDWVQFSVRDTGPGIPKEEMTHLFERYWQAGKTQDLGTGLGLAICHELIVAHRGRIWVESELGVGTVFHFTLPTVNAARTLGLCGQAPVTSDQHFG